MNWKRWLLIGSLVLGLLAVGALSTSWAQDYRFTLDRNLVHVIVNRDGSADIEYWLTFTCDPGAHAIDIVDVGLPNKSYRLDSAVAKYVSSDGVESPLGDVRKSEWLDVGVEIHLDEHLIWPGEQGTVYLRINVGEMVYPDTSDETYASLRFTPHYYDPANTHGSTELEIHFYFPPGVTPQESRYHEREFDGTDMIYDRLVFVYLYPDASPSKAYPHGISFPRSAVDVVNKAPVVGGRIRSGGSGSAARRMGPISGYFGLGMIFLLVAGIVGGIVIWHKRRKIRYVPPMLSVEGVGVKLRLTAVEAAVLLERPLDNILTMVMFGLLKKGALRVLSEDPLRLEVVQSQPEGKLHNYERAFLASIKGDGSLNEEHLEGMLVWLVKGVNAKMRGFSRRETVVYYKGIVDRAWDQVESATTPEIKSAHFDQGLEWMMMDDHFGRRSRRILGEGPVRMPSWWTYYRPWEPTVHSSGLTALRSSRGNERASTGRSSRTRDGRQTTLPTLPGAAFASMVVGGIERSADRVVSRLESFTGRVGDRLRAHTGTVTQPAQRAERVPMHSRSETLSTVLSSDDSTFTCACACACAGCACACAGGGR